MKRNKAIEFLHVDITDVYYGCLLPHRNQWQVLWIKHRKCTSIVHFGYLLMCSVKGVSLDKAQKCTSIMNSGYLLMCSVKEVSLNNTGNYVFYFNGCTKHVLLFLFQQTNVQQYISQKYLFK
jgi:hypothetical protein